MLNWSETQIVQIKTETDWIRTIRFAYSPDSTAVTLRPGDAVAIRTHRFLKQIVGYYSLSKVSSHEFEVTMKRPGEVKSLNPFQWIRLRLFDIAYKLHFSQPGAIFEFSKLEGAKIGFHFEKDEIDLQNPTEKIVFISGGLGVTLNMAIFRRIIEEKLDERKPIYFIFSIRTEKDFVFREELLKLEQTHPNIKLIVHKTREGSLSSRISSAFLESILTTEEIKNSKYFVCGSPSFSQEITQSLIKIGATEKSIKSAGN